MSGPSFGVEEEFLLVDPLTGHPVALNCEVAHHALRRGVELQFELTTAQIETNTEKAQTSEQLREQIWQLRKTAAAAAEEAGALLLAAGLPPSGQTLIPITDNPRYRRMTDWLGMVSYERGNCGCHVHVEVPSRDAAISVSNWLRPWLPMMIALTANSAFYRDTDTGHASWRSVMWARWPSAGPPPYFDCPADYDRAISMLLDSGAMLDDGMLYWDIRPSVRFPTVEIRAADVPATAAETVLYATLVRAAVMTALGAYERGEPAPRIPDYAVRSACWKAAHEGLDGRLVDLLGPARTVPAADLLQDWVTALTPALSELGDRDWVHDEIRALLVRGNGAMRQRQAWRAREGVRDVVSAVCAATVS